MAAKVSAHLEGFIRSCTPPRHPDLSNRAAAWRFLIGVDARREGAEAPGASAPPGAACAGLPCPPFIGKPPTFY